MKRKAIDKKRLLKLGWPFLVLFILSIVVLVERSGLRATEVDKGERQEFDDRLYDVSDDEFSPAVSTQIECLIITSSKDFQSETLLPDVKFVLDDMRVGYRVCDLASESLPDLAEYEKIVVAISDLNALGEGVITLCDWVAEGGHMMNTGTFESNEYFYLLANKIGVININDLRFVETSGMKIANGFMINGKDLVIPYEQKTNSTLSVALIPECRVGIEDMITGYPLLWEVDYGKGKFVISNQVVYGKEVRGLFSTSYSLLGDICAYPVINASAFYIDDFPSPIPQGSEEGISRDYGTTISNFYYNIWWPDMLRLEEEYGVIHTGLIMEDYSDIVEPPFVRNRSVERASLLGNMMLNNGGEIGLHGYNHMPLCMDNYDYLGLYESYKKWPSMENMEESIAELIGFTEELFPNVRLGVYVPPSNILSSEGREALKNSWPDFKVIASNYFGGDAVYQQEFCVGEDGIVETPRVTSGCVIEDFMKLSAFSELNFHFVQSHFLHPDDVMDVERGADLGWKEMYRRLSEYTDYIYAAAPMIRNVSGTGMGEAVREFDKLSVERTYKEDTLELKLGGFYKEAYFLVRINEGFVKSVSGGEIEHVTGDIYLLHATESQVQIRYR